MTQARSSSTKTNERRLAKLNILIIFGFSFDIGHESRQKLTTSTAQAKQSKAHHTDRLD